MLGLQRRISAIKCAPSVSRPLTSLILLQIRIIEKQQLFCSELQVDVKTASRLATCKDEVRGITGAQRIDISPTSTNSNRQSVCLSGTKEALSAATDKIRQIERAVLTEKEVSIVIPSQSRSIIIGPQWQTWSEIVLRCGGPSDLQAQKNIIEIDPSCDVVRLRGTPSILDKLTAEIKARTKTVYAVRISNRWHRKLFPYAKDIAHSTETTILFPGHDAYHSLGEPANVAKMQGEVKSDIVKFYGTISGYEAARRSLESHLRDLKGKERTISVPSRYEHAVYECVFAKLSARGVTISPILNSQGYFPDRPMGATSDGIEEVQWNVVDRWRNLDSNSTWTLAARDKQDLPRAVEWINESLQQLWEVQRVGFLTLLDRSKFSLIVGPGGQTVTRIQQETGAIVRVPSNRPCDAQDRTITIIGSDKTIEEARQRIMRIVDSTPRRRKGSIASIDPVRAAAMSA
ncbi:hypothetical protein JAAARDRAFT_311487 [Jaapia argillacea MUCL 33604]|uniref:K Homology domain-containing protein n=1 Tax=Jaapia argillacea MUCL 33604 TaxID=933084 RepID=A0A067PNM9_9AGAM|nr:hypothetical protein JAAARDRAFT_311487 [Jaapia argillacea MUCL 33604]